ncbi:MAG: hypothetical protein LBQ65_06925, partial [Tannerellaceae bacterium]|nr:hypothetical protein [Tannerellaceae bacterium]
FIKAYPKWEKDTNAYDLIFRQLQNLTPIKDRDDMSIHIHSAHNYVNAYKNHPQTPEEENAYCIAITPWGEWLGMDIAATTIEDYSDEEIISHCLWEMTFYGYSQENIQKKAKRWGNAEKEIQEKEQKFPDVKKEIKNTKKLKK